MSMLPIVFLIDDDRPDLISLCASLSSAGFLTQSFLSAEEFLDHLPDDARGCVVTDLKLTGMSGLHLQEQLLQMRSHLPVIVLTGRADVALAVKVMEYGAVTLIQKPYDHNELIHAVKKALEQNAHRHTQAEFIADVQERFNSLTEDEQQVLRMVVDGRPKQVHCDDAQHQHANC